MTVTTSFSLGDMQSYGISDGLHGTNLSSLDFTSLANGGIAFIGTHNGYGHSDIGLNGYASDIFSGYSGSVDQLKSGKIAFVGDGGGNIFWELTDSGLGGATSGDLALANSSNADVAALSAGRFVITAQRNFGGSDNDIEVYLRASNGSAVTNFAVDSSGADDERASVAGLKDGGFVVAWDRGAGAEAWFAAYNSDGGTRLAARAFDPYGSTNKEMSVTACQNGNFAIAYEDSGWTGTYSHITVALFRSNGHRLDWVDVSDTAVGDESQASLTTLQDGTIAVTWTHEFNPTDHDIYLQLIDPKTGEKLLSSPQIVSSSSNNESASTVTALDDGRILVGWQDDSLGAVAKSLQLYIDYEGDAAKNRIIGKGAFDTINGFGGSDQLKGGAGDDTIDGGLGKDIVNGQAGSDVLTGGAGRDTFQFSSIGDIAGGDTIIDLTHFDHINLAAIDADTGTAGNQAFVIVSAFTGAAGQMKVDYNVTHAGQTTLQFDVNGDSVSDGEIVIQGDQTSFANYVL